MIRHKRTIEQKFKAIVAMIVAMGLVSGFTLQDGTISDAWSLEAPATISITHTTHACSGDENKTHEYDEWVFKGDAGDELWEKCSNCPAEEKTSHGKSHTYTKNYYKHDSENNKDYRVCDDCGYVDLGSVQACVFGAWTDDSASGDHSHHVRTCTNCGIQEIVTVPSMTYTSNADKATHTATCNCCGDGTAKSEDCTPTSWHVIVGGKHSGRCSKCTQTVEKTCDDDANGDGFCDSLEPKGAAAKTKADSILSNAKAKGWQDSYKDSEGKATQEGKDWANGLSDSDLDSLYNDYKDFESKELAAAKSEGGPNIDDYMKTSGASALGEALENAKSPAAVMLGGAVAAPKMGAGGSDPDIAIEFYDKNSPTTKITGSGTIILKQDSTSTEIEFNEGDLVEISSATTGDISKVGTTITLISTEKIVVTPKTTPSGAPNGYKNLVSGTYEFTPDYTSGTISMSDVSGAFVKHADSKGMNVFFEPLPEVIIELVKSDAPGTPLVSGASIKMTDGIIASPIPYNIGDKIVVGTPVGGANISKNGTIITILKNTAFTIIEGTTPPGYSWGTGDTIFEATDAATPALDISASTSSRQSKTGNTLKITYTKPTEIAINQYESGGKTTKITSGSLEISKGTEKVTWKNGDKIVVGTPSGATYISKNNSTNTITILKDTTFDVVSLVAPIGYEKLATKQFAVKPSGNDIDIATGTGYDNVFEKNSSPLGIDIYFTKASNSIKFTKGGDGAPDTVTYVISSESEDTVTSDGSGIALADGTYTLTAKTKKFGYDLPSGKFTITGGQVVSSSVTGDVKYKSTDSVELKFSDKAGIKVYVYPEDDGKADLDEDPLKDWNYVLYKYKGSKSDPTKDTTESNWTKVYEVTPKSGKKYAEIDPDKIDIDVYYKLVNSDNSKEVAYFYLEDDGTINAKKGNIKGDDSENTLILWTEDEDSDDLIAVHKVNNTGTELAGAHLQIYLYTETNTLYYGSTTTSSTTSNSSTNSSSSSTTSSTSSTTKAKTTPTKPTVSSSDVKFDWTTTDKAKTINIDDLEKGKNYTLREVSAPSGYETPAYDFVFKYGTDGKITIVKNYNGLLSVTGNKLVLKNQTPTEAAATRPKTGDHSKLALWLDICIVMLGGLYLSGYSIFEAFTEKKKVKVVAKKKPNNRRRR